MTNLWPFLETTHTHLVLVIPTSNDYHWPEHISNENLKHMLILQINGELQD